MSDSSGSWRVEGRRLTRREFSPQPEGRLHRGLLFHLVLPVRSEPASGIGMADRSIAFWRAFQFDILRQSLAASVCAGFKAIAAFCVRLPQSPDFGSQVRALVPTTIESAAQSGSSAATSAHGKVACDMGIRTRRKGCDLFVSELGDALPGTQNIARSCDRGQRPKPLPGGQRLTAMASKTMSRANCSKI
jgi:hypothetical protein